MAARGWQTVRLSFHIENRTTLELPLTDAEFDALDVRFRHADRVKEDSPVYLVR